MHPQSETPVRSPEHVITRDNPPCILLVEDDRAVAEMLEATFRAWGYKVLIARNGQEGLEILTSQSVDGILLDMHMPIMNGLTMLDELRWIGYQLPVWMMSGESDAQTLRQLLHEGAQGFYIKPFQPQSLQQFCAQIV